MPRFTTSFLINAPQDAVWAACTDLADWEGYSEAKIEELTDQPFGVGTRWRETRRMFGRDSASEWRVTRVEQPNLYTAVSEWGSATWVFDMFFVPEGEGTRVVVETSMKDSRGLSALGLRASWPLMITMMRRGMEREFQALDKALA